MTIIISQTSEILHPLIIFRAWKRDKLLYRITPTKLHNVCYLGYYIKGIPTRSQKAAHLLLLLEFKGSRRQ